MSANPYETPLASYAHSEPVLVNKDTVDFRVVVKRWELMRIAYNVILIFWCLLIGLIYHRNFVLNPEFILMLLVGGCVSNTCYFIGPMIEGYASVFRIWHRYLSYATFALGLMLTALAAAVAISNFQPAN